jgi:SPFH domain / Band 7 family
MEVLGIIILFVIGGVFVLLFRFTFFGRFFGRRFPVEVLPGEVVALYYEDSRRCKDVYDKPGRHWYSFSELVKLRSLRLWVNEPFIITSGPVEARTHDGMSAILTIRLTMDVTNPVGCVTAMVGKEVAEWKEEVLPTLITQVVSGYTMTETLNKREQVAQSIESDVAAWFAGNRSSDFGLSFKRAAIIDVASPRH